MIADVPGHSVAKLGVLQRHGGMKVLSILLLVDCEIQLVFSPELRVVRKTFGAIQVKGYRHLLPRRTTKGETGQDSLSERLDRSSGHDHVILVHPDVFARTRC